MSYPIGLFEGFGVELEYMIVDRESMAVRPLADAVLRGPGGEIASEVEKGAIAWSNELVLHVIELKTNGPARQLAGLSEAFHLGVADINARLERHGARLMPTGMHPWMDPETETRLWPHEYNEVYEAFNRVFDCRGHGWANLQSVHINLPFRDDAEFGRLHAAIRMVLPILPALAASSPVAGGCATGLLDNRLEFYRQNCRRVPSVTGAVIPERVFTQDDYENELLAGVYRDIAPFDPGGILQHEWVNARGAIARFDRGAIEIRLLDVQECPKADLAVVSAVVQVLGALVDERLSSYPRQKDWPEQRLAPLLLAAIRDGQDALVSDPEYLDDMGYRGPAPVRAGDLWRHLVDTVVAPGASAEEGAILETILTEGCLAMRILHSLGPEPARIDLERVYRALCDSLAENRVFHASV